MKIRERTFVVTGGNRGIGLAVAEMAARAGAGVVIVSRAPEESLQPRLLELGAKSVRLISADLSSREGTERLAAQLEALDVDFLFNNAGSLTGGLIEDQPLDEIYSMFQVNLLSLVHLTRAVIPGMVRRGSGKIINNASVSAFMHFPCASTYSASKAAVVAFTNCIDMELRGTGVSTLCLVTPGIKTRMFDEIAGKYGRHLEVPLDSISPSQYAELVREAIEKDRPLLIPRGLTGFGLWLSRFMNPVFQGVVRRKFSRQARPLGGSA